VVECRRGTPHLPHLWLPWLSDEHTRYLQTEILRWCEGEPWPEVKP
jgi:hypothetical protein